MFVGDFSDEALRVEPVEGKGDKGGKRRGGGSYLYDQKKRARGPNRNHIGESWSSTSQEHNAGEFGTNGFSHSRFSVVLGQGDLED